MGVFVTVCTGEEVIVVPEARGLEEDFVIVDPRTLVWPGVTVMVDDTTTRYGLSEVPAV